MGWIWHLCLMNMKRRKIRTFLTVLGVMIGVISVVALLAGNRSQERDDRFCGCKWKCQPDNDIQ